LITFTQVVEELRMFAMHPLFFKLGNSRSQRYVLFTRIL